MATKKTDIGYKDMTTEQLSAKLTEMQAEYQKRRFTKVTGELTQVHLVKAARRDIARIKTYLRAHALQAAKK